MPTNIPANTPFLTAIQQSGAAASTGGGTPAPWQSWPGPDSITVRKRKMPNPFSFLSRTDWGPWDRYAGELERQTISPATLYRTKAEPMIATTAAEDEAMAGDIVKNNLGPAFAAQYRARAGQNLSQGLGQAAGLSQIESAQHNAGIWSQLLDQLLGRKQTESSERDSDIGHQGDILQYLIGL